jgi:4-hydroxybenzoate polyprenyltransferase
MDTFATRAILLWMLVAAGLAYGVINTINQVVDLFSG